MANTTVPENDLQTIDGHPTFFSSVEVFDQPFKMIKEKKKICIRKVYKKTNVCISIHRTQDDQSKAQFYGTLKANSLLWHKLSWIYILRLMKDKATNGYEP